MRRYHTSRSGAGSIGRASKRIFNSMSARRPSLPYRAAQALGGSPALPGGSEARERFAWELRRAKSRKAGAARSHAGRPPRPAAGCFPRAARAPSQSVDIAVERGLAAFTPDTMPAAEPASALRRTVSRASSTCSAPSATSSPRAQPHRRAACAARGDRGFVPGVGWGWARIVRSRRRHRSNPLPLSPRERGAKPILPPPSRFAAAAPTAAAPFRRIARSAWDAGGWRSRPE